VTGAADHAADDVHPRGLVHPILVGSEVTHGRITQIDVDAAGVP